MSSPKDSPMMNKQNASFGEVLRAVGQGLESLNVENFELQAEGDGYFVLGTPRSPSPGAVESGSMQPGVKNTLQNAWYSITDRVSHKVKASDAMPNVLRVLFTRDGIRRLQCEGEAKRSEESAGIPNLNKISQILRMVGEYIDAKSGRLISACKSQNWISFDYETVAHFRITKKWKVAELYEYWLEVSDQRQRRHDIVERELAGERRKPKAAPLG